MRDARKGNAKLSRWSVATICLSVRQNQKRGRGESSRESELLLCLVLSKSGMARKEHAILINVDAYFCHVSFRRSSYGMRYVSWTGVCVWYGKDFVLCEEVMVVVSCAESLVLVWSCAFKST